MEDSGQRHSLRAQLPPGPWGGAWAAAEVGLAAPCPEPGSSEEGGPQFPHLAAVRARRELGGVSRDGGHPRLRLAWSSPRAGGASQMAQGARVSVHAHVGRARASGPGASLSTASALVLSPQPSCRFCTWPQRVPGRREEAGLALDTSASASAAGGCPVAAWGSVPPAEASASGGLGKPLPRTAQPHTGPGSWICPADGLWGCGAPLPLALLSPESRHLLPRGAGAGVSAAAVGRLRALPTPRARRPPPLALHPARRPPVAQFLPASDPVCITLGHGGRCQDVLRCLAAAPPQACGAPPSVSPRGLHRRPAAWLGHQIHRGAWAGLGRGARSDALAAPIGTAGQQGPGGHSVL